MSVAVGGEVGVGGASWATATGGAAIGRRINRKATTPIKAVRIIRAMVESRAMITF
jgi:hypothetical protein